MTGWFLFVQSVRALVQHPAMAVRLTALPYVISALAHVLLVGAFFNQDQASIAAAFEQGRAPFAGMAADFVLQMLTLAWMAVAWHRFILADKVPSSFASVEWGRVLAYVGTSLTITLMILLAALGLMIPAGLLVLALGAALGPQILATPVIVAAVLVVPLVVIGMRLSTALPAIALGPGADFLSGWRATKGKSLSLILFAVLTYGLQVLLGYASRLPFADWPEAAMTMERIVTWPGSLLAISGVTTLYAHYIEGRPLR